MASGDIPLASPLEGGYAVEIPAPTPWVADGAVVIQGTGELLDIREADANTLGRLLVQLRSIKDQLEGVKHLVDEEIVARMDRNAEWTMHVGGIKLTAPGPDQTEFKGDLLRANLLPLVESGKISASALEAAVEEVIDYKPRKRGINALLKLGGQIAKAVRHAEVPKDSRRNVRFEIEA